MKAHIFTLLAYSHYAKCTFYTGKNDELFLVEIGDQVIDQHGLNGEEDKEAIRCNQQKHSADFLNKNRSA